MGSTKFLKNKRSDIPPLNCSSGTAVTDTQKANILAESILDNFTENPRPNNDFDNDDELINNTVNTFLSFLLPLLLKLPIPLRLLAILRNLTLKKRQPGKNKNIPSSYRPISLLSTLSKITESIILTRLKEFLYTNNIINPNQYGFTNKLSTLHPLLNLTEAISEGFQSKKSTGAVFLDIQKAFDRVWLTGLTYKLINYKIPTPLVFLLHSYNSNRSYQVRVKDTLSTTKFINCGVAQGSLLGPLLFNLYINDIPEYSLTKLNMYADDTAVHTTFKRITSVTFALNKHLKLLENYYDRWKISINVEKSAAVLFTKKRKIPPPPKNVQHHNPMVSKNPHDPGNYSNDWLDQSAASYMLAGYSPQPFLLYYSDMGWRLASRAICPDIVTVVTVGLPKTADPENIKTDLEAEGFEPDKVTQLMGRRTKQKLPHILSNSPKINREP
ncbi:probable RNA-directed DNA polymerase from transposon X-element [Trichonephila clavipes]|nr:probable RNA-directed DNA polymerase from transposon X-element [Trichonephila clavipes]